MATIVLTGATGFLGSHILKAILDMEYDVIILKRTTSDTKRINHLLDRVKVYDIDRTDMMTIFSESGVDVVINTVCSYGRSSESTVDIVSTNLLFSLNLLEAAVKHNVKTFINTDSLLPRNVNAYSLSKAQFVDWLQFYSGKIQIVNMRIEHMYGPGDDTKKFIPWLVGQILDNDGDILLTSGIQQRDFVFIDDVVKAYDLVLQKRTTLAQWNEFDVGTSNFSQVKDIVLEIAEKLQHKKQTAIVPRLKFGALSYRPNDCMKPDLNNKSLLELGWKHTTGAYAGISKYIDALMKAR